MRPRTEVGRNSFPTSPTFPVHGCPDGQKSVWARHTPLYFILVLESSAGVISVRLLRSHGAPGAPLKQGDWHIIYITCACTLEVY